MLFDFESFMITFFTIFSFDDSNNVITKISISRFLFEINTKIVDLCDSFVDSFVNSFVDSFVDQFVVLFVNSFVISFDDINESKFVHIEQFSIFNFVDDKISNKIRNNRMIDIEINIVINDEHVIHVKQN